MIVLDASAVLAFLQGESGADRVEQELEQVAVIGAANWSEIVQKITARGADLQAVRALIEGYGVSIEPVTQTDAEAAAGLWEAGSPLSLGDRLCLALAERLGVPALTADRAWGESDQVLQIRR